MVALSASPAIFETLGYVLLTARVMASMACLGEMRGTDPAPMMNQARTRGRSLEHAGNPRGAYLSRASERELAGAQKTDTTPGSAIGARGIAGWQPSPICR